jgi:hypothetical protein
VHISEVFVGDGTAGFRLGNTALAVVLSPLGLLDSVAEMVHSQPRRGGAGDVGATDQPDCTSSSSSSSSSSKGEGKGKGESSSEKQAKALVGDTSTPGPVMQLDQDLLLYWGDSGYTTVGDGDGSEADAYVTPQIHRQMLSND